MRARDTKTPLFSVMVPTFNPKADYLDQALTSVTSQDMGTGSMQIEVVDDSSPITDPEEMAGALSYTRIRYSRTPVNLGLAGCWNECIERAHGEWVHILHQDDYVLPGFYAEIQRLAESYPDVGLIGVRSFFVDEEGVIRGVTPRVRSLEKGGHDVRELLYTNLLQCPGILVRKRSYQAHGGFRRDLCYTLDWEMWTRIVASDGGVISPRVLACYREAGDNATSRLAREGKTFTDMLKIFELFSERYEGFDPIRANEIVCGHALGQARAFELLHDHATKDKYLRFWRSHASATIKAKHYARTIYRAVEGARRRLRKQ